MAGTCNHHHDLSHIHSWQKTPNIFNGHAAPIVGVHAHRTTIDGCLVVLKPDLVEDEGLAPLPSIAAPARICVAIGDGARVPSLGRERVTIG